MSQQSTAAQGQAVESLERADRNLLKAARALGSVGEGFAEAPLLKEEVLDVLTRVRAQRDMLEAELEAAGS